MSWKHFRLKSLRERNKAVLIVGAGRLQIPMIRQARKRRLRVIATDGDVNAPGLQLADDPIVLDTYDFVAHGELGHELQSGLHRMGERLIGVATCGADVAPSVAEAAATAETPGLSPYTAHQTHNKFTVRQALWRAGLQEYQPRWMALDISTDNLNHSAIRDRFTTWGGGLVIKPFKQCASRGISLCLSLDDLDMACETVWPYAQADGAFLIEERLEGSEHSAEVVFNSSGVPCFFNIVDRMFTYDDGIAMEIGHVNPSRIRQRHWQAIYRLVLDTAQALGVAWGPWKVDVILTRDGPKVLECTARLSGGFDCQETTPRATGRNPIGQVLTLATGGDSKASLDDVPQSSPKDFWAACAAAFPEPGRVTSLPPIDAALDMPGVETIYVTIGLGDTIEPYQHCAQRPGFVIASSNDYGNAWRRARNAAQVLAEQFVTTTREP